MPWDFSSMMPVTEGVFGGRPSAYFIRLVKLSPAGVAFGPLMEGFESSAAVKFTTAHELNDPAMTVTVKVLLAALPARSLAAAVTVVVPTGKEEPGAGVFTVGIAPSTASTAEVEKLTAAPAAPVALTVMSAGTTTEGGVRSSTLTARVEELSPIGLFADSRSR